MNITILGFLGIIAKLSDICFSCVAKFSLSFSHSPLTIILKQLFPSGSVNNAEYLSRLLLGKYSAIFILRLRRIIVKQELRELKPARDAHSCHITNIEPLAS